jgi:hypothetical protein
VLTDRLPDPPVSYSDLLALLTSSDEADIPQIIELVAARLRNANLDGVFVLPAFRGEPQARPVRVSPADLINREWDPYLLGSVLSRLGLALGAHAVIVDLRAGLTELAAGLLLDPRVHRVLVTTTSDQSLTGTRALIDLLAADAPAVEELAPGPALIVSQIPTGKEAAAIADAEIAQLLEQLATTTKPPVVRESAPLDQAASERRCCAHVLPPGMAGVAWDLGRITQRA